MHPRTIEDYGPCFALNNAKTWLSTWERGMPPKRGVLLYGPPGSGKTTLVRCLANSYGLELVDVNASADRSKEAMEEVMDLSLNGGVMILLDEADSMTQNEKAVVTRMLKYSKCPVFVVANDEDRVSKSIRSACFEIQVPPPSKERVMAVGRALNASPRTIAKARSYRDLVNENVVGDDVVLPKRQRIEAALRGLDADLSREELMGMEAWVLDNTTDLSPLAFDEARKIHLKIGKRAVPLMRRGVTVRAAEVAWPWSYSIKPQEPVEEVPPAPRAARRESGGPNPNLKNKVEDAAEWI